MSRLAEVFLDSAFAIALSAPADLFHTRAVQLADQMERDGTKIVTTRAVMLEIGNALGKQRYRADAVVLLDSLENDRNVDIVPPTEELFARAFQLYRSRADKEWGLVDCVSFTVMTEHGISSGLTTDEHFRQAGFTVLLEQP